MVELVRYVYTQARGPKILVIVLSILSGLSRASILAAINGAAAAASAKEGLLIYFVAFVAGFGTYLWSTYFTSDRTVVITEGLINRLRMRLCRKVFFTELRFVEDATRPVLSRALIGDINDVGSFIGTILRTLQGAIMLVFAVAYVGWLSMTGLAISLIAASIGVWIYLARYETIARNQLLQRKNQVFLHGQLDSMIDGFKELKSSRAKRSDFVDDLAKLNDIHRELAVNTARISLTNRLATQSVTFCLIAAVLFGLPLFFDHDSTMVFQIVTAILFLVGPLESVISAIPKFSKAKVAFENVQKIENDVDRSLSESLVSDSEHSFSGFDSVDIRELVFTYTRQDDEQPFSVGPIDLTIKRGELVFIGGANGSGKTTLLKLLTGLYLPQSGEIRVDGEEVGMEHYQSYRELFGTIFYDFYLFLRLFGVTDVNHSELDALLKALKLDDRAHYVDGRFSTTRLSAGQRRRLAYVVAYLDRRQVYVFDEFAAEQDPYFRHYFYFDLLPSLVERGKTVIAVTHDDRYFHLADRLLIMRDGQLEEEETDAR